ncbi:MAG: hypothetical protein ACTSRU_16385 [Candidatus Hodarchaeales archaeon]
MGETIKVRFPTAEAVPLVKIARLRDIAGSLPAALGIFPDFVPK